MKKLLTVFMALGLGCLLAGPVQSANIGLFDYAFNANGVVSSKAAGEGVSLAGFDTSTGLGSITWTSSTAVADNNLGFFLAFFDHEIDEATNTFFNEFGAVFNSPAATQSWEIDEPEYFYGNIWTNFNNASLDNSNGVPQGSEDDVAMAMGWNYALAAGERAIITLLLSTTAPTSGFYLQQTDPDSQVSIYLSSSFRTEGGGTTVPEPGTLLLLGTGLAGLAGLRRRRKR